MGRAEEKDHAEDSKRQVGLFYCSESSGSCHKHRPMSNLDSVTGHRVQAQAQDKGCTSSYLSMRQAWQCIRCWHWPVLPDYCLAAGTSAVAGSSSGEQLDCRCRNQHTHLEPTPACSCIAFMTPYCLSCKETQGASHTYCLLTSRYRSW